jgi:hypothetical protein
MWQSASPNKSLLINTGSPESGLGCWPPGNRRRAYAMTSQSAAASNEEPNAGIFFDGVPSRIMRAMSASDMRGTSARTRVLGACSPPRRSRPWHEVHVVAKTCRPAMSVARRAFRATGLHELPLRPAPVETSAFFANQDARSSAKHETAMRDLTRAFAVSAKGEPLFSRAACRLRIAKRTSFRSR